MTKFGILLVSKLKLQNAHTKIKGFSISQLTTSLKGAEPSLICRSAV